MDNTGTTVYFAGFEFGATEDEFRVIFSEFGTVEKIFLHKTKNYGMVEFNSSRPCLEAIETLHLQPPLNLHVNMAKNQISNNISSGSSQSNGNAFASSSKRPQNFNKQNYSFDKQQGGNFIDETIIYDVEDYYLDENNEFVTVFTDPITNEIYVPLRYAPSLRKVSRKVPRKISGFDDERLSIKSDNSERRVKVKKMNDSIQNITIEKNIEIENSFNKTHNKFGNSFDKNSASNNNLFDKKTDKKRYDQNDGFNRNPNPGQWNGENRNSNIPNRGQFPSASNSSFKTSRESMHVPKKIQSNDEDWSSSVVNQAKISNMEKSALKNIQVFPDKVESVAALKSKAVPATTTTTTTTTPIVADKPKEKFVVKTIELPENQFTEVQVQNVVNNNVGWVTLTDKVSEFENLTLEICQEIESAPICIPQVGKLVFAFYEELWFRAIILSTSPDIIVRYIDYGNKETVSKADIKEMPAAFAQIPAFAICIKLADGAPCKILNDITIKVKPVGKEKETENDLIVVHVENGIYDIEEIQPKKNEHLLCLFHKLLISQIDIGHNGFLEMNICLNKNKCIAAFMPLHLTEEAAKLQSINPAVNSSSFKVNVGDIVCAENEDGWQRVYVLKIENGIYHVAFIDFGFVKDVSEVRPLPTQFINIPIFSCVCTSINNEHLTEIKEAVDFEITHISGNDITCTIQFNQKQIHLLCNPWDPRDLKQIVSPATTTTTTNQQCHILKEILLKNGENVKLEMESDGFLYVRNKQATDIQKKIDKFMSINGSKATSLNGNAYIGQLVTAQFEGDFYRAVIKSITDNDVTICYVDYGNEETLPFLSLKKLNEEMMDEPTTIIKIRLRNFIDKPFSVKALNYLENLAIQKTILKATYENSPDDGYDLKTANGLSISAELEKLNACAPNPKAKSHENVVKQPVEEENEFYKTIKIPSDNEPKILMFNLPLEEIPLGETEVIFQQFSDIGNNILCVCLNDAQILHKVHVEMQNQISKYVQNKLPNSSYQPEIEECVLVQNEGKWYRGACTSEPENDEYTIFLVDYGSCNQFSSKNMRRMPKEFAKEKALCNFAVFHDLPDNPSQNLRNRLKALLERNHSYPVNVLKKIEEDECYIMQFPSIIEVLKKEKLL